MYLVNIVRIKRAMFEKSSWIKDFWIIYLSIRDFFWHCTFDRIFSWLLVFSNFYAKVENGPTIYKLMYDQNRNNNYLIFFSSNLQSGNCFWRAYLCLQYGGNKCSISGSNDSLNSVQFAWGLGLTFPNSIKINLQQEIYA